MCKEQQRVHPGIRTACVALAAIALGGGCFWDDDYVDPYYYDYYYPYAYYYPVDLSYSSVYYTDAWLYSDWYYAEAPQTIAQDNTWSGVGSFIRALARGESICPGQVTITPKMSPPACQMGDTTSVRSGANLVFNGCKTPNGGTLEGTIDITANRTATEQVCSASTKITLSHTTTITNFSYTAPNGSRLVIPTQTDTGTNTYTYGETPTRFSFESTGRLQLYAASGGALGADLTHNGARTVSYSSANKSYSVSGIAAVEEARSGGRATLAGDQLTRVTDCCAPVSGMLRVSRTGGTNPGEHTWSFGPACGQTTLDGTAREQPICM